MTEDGTDVEEKARALFEKFSDQLRRDWEDHTIPSNPTVRGSSYEEGLANFLRQYFGNKYIVSTNVSLIDNKLACFDVFTDGQNEFDVVATFSQAEPRISIESGDVQWIPLSGVAFLCEVKSKLTKPSLESDLEKLQSIRQLAANPGDRFIGNAPGEYSTNRHILIGAYKDAEISDESLDELLQEYRNAWDIIFIVDTDTIIVNSNLPIVRVFGYPPKEFIEGERERDYIPKELLDEMEESYCLTRSHGLALMTISLAYSIPNPRSVKSILPIQRMLGGSSFSQPESLKPTTSPDEDWHGPNYFL